MSNRYSHERHEGGKGFVKTQKKFVPKTSNSIPRDSDTNTTLSNSLRQSDSRSGTPASSPGGAAAVSSTQVRMVDKGDSASGRAIQGGNFVEYLPQDEAVAVGLGADEGGLDPVESQRVVDLLNRELSRLLKLNTRDFWMQVASDNSLHAFLESFLKFRSRWYDFPYRGAKGIVAGVIVGDFELSKRVFMILYRISSNRDPGARAAYSLSSKDHTVLLQEKKLLNLPKLLDICAIYGHENEDLTRILVTNAITAQPWIHDNFHSVMSHFLGIMHTMFQRCTSSLEVMLSSYNEDHRSKQLHGDYLEVMDFINDAIVSMDAFVGAYKHAAVFFSCPVEMSYGNEELLGTLARLHDSLLPSLNQGFRVIFGTEKDRHEELSNVLLSLKMLSARIVKFGYKLLYFCYLGDELFEESFPLPALTKIFPAKVEDPVIRSDILVQTFRELSAGYSLAHEWQSRGTFLQNLEKNHKIMNRIESLQKTGWILMDDEQLQFLSGIIMHPSEFNINGVPNKSIPVVSNELQMDEDTAIVESKISQIKDIFPDYGGGFLSACLEVYNHNPEEVIQRILEGTLHADLQALDTSLDKIPQPASTKSLTRQDKGKGKLVESTTPAPISDRAMVVGERQVGSKTFSSLTSSSVGRYVRKSAIDVSDHETLNTRDEKTSAKTAALASQLDYEDEYDDSFDDLGLSVADSGLEENEVQEDRLDSNWGKSSESESGSTAPAASNSSRWGSRKKPQFYVKDGKNYSYNVVGSVAAANYNEASLLNQAQKELIHGLGRGGNIPLGAVRRMAESNEVPDNDADAAEAGDGANPENSRGRGRGRRGGGGRHHYRKDRLMKKHIASLGGH